MKQIEKFFLVVLLLPLLTVVFSCATPYMPPSGEGTNVSQVKETVKSGNTVNSFNEKLLLSLGKIKHREYRLMPGDVVEVSVFGIDELQNLTGTIDARKKVNLPLVGSVKLGGLTVPEAKKVLEKVFKEYVEDPKVSLEIKEYNGYRISVLGAVNKPDVYSLKGSRTVLDAIALAGGLRKDASKTVILTHMEAEKQNSIIIDLNKLIEQWNIMDDLMLSPGDIVYVPKAKYIFVDGFVRHPNAYPMTEPVTLSQAISKAGGMLIDADPSKVAIYRKSLSGNKKIIYADMDKIRNGEEKDIALEPEDIVVVPSSALRVFVYRFFGISYGPSGPGARMGR